MSPKTKAELLESVRAGQFSRDMQKLRELNAELLAALKEMAEFYGGAHEDNCPMDDTCVCKWEAFNFRVNDAIAKAEALK